MKIYVIINVSYDYYRFQNNVGVARTYEEAMAVVSSLDLKLKITSSLKESNALRENEEEHYYIEEWELP